MHIQHILRVNDNEDKRRKMINTGQEMQIHQKRRCRRPYVDKMFIGSNITIETRMIRKSYCSLVTIDRSVSKIFYTEI